MNVGRHARIVAARLRRDQPQICSICVKLDALTRATPQAILARMQGSSIAPNTDDYAERLRRHHIQPTAQRLKVAALLFCSRQHLTAEQLLASLDASDAAVSKATLYNTLNLFVERGLVRQVAVDGARTWFDSHIEPHYHFQDLRSGLLSDIALQDVSFNRLPDPPDGMEVDGIEVVIRLRPKA